MDPEQPPPTPTDVTDASPPEPVSCRMLDASPEFGGLSDHEWMRRRAIAIQAAITDGRITFAGQRIENLRGLSTKPEDSGRD